MPFDPAAQLVQVLAPLLPTLTQLGVVAAEGAKPATQQAGVAQYIVPILQTGLGGLVFLVAFMGYRLLSRKELNAKVGKAVQRYLLICAGLIVVVGLFTAVDKYLRHGEPAQVLGGCRDSLDRLKTASSNPALTATQLRNFIDAHVESCEGPLEQANAN